jgi:nucleotide-binding universal stress UspA family protein
MEMKFPYEKILLPIDGSEHSKRAVQFTGYLGISLRRHLSGITLLRVITGRYMKSYIPFFDLRAEILKQSDSFTNYKQRYIDTNILPSLDECEGILRDIGIKNQIEKVMVEGDPSKEIIQIANEGNFSTIIMARRGISEFAGMILGSVTNKVVHSAIGQTVYIIGQRIPEGKRCPITKVLIPLDGSSYSMKGVIHIASLFQELKDFIDNITLLKVINLALFVKRLKEGIDSEEEAEKILNEAKEILSKSNIPEKIISTKVRVGDPSEEIIREAEENDYNLIIIGRKGRTALKDLILGGVSTTVFQRCQDTTIALVSSE